MPDQLTTAERFRYGAKGKPAIAAKTCAACADLDDRPLPSGLRYCWRNLNWRWPTDDACKGLTGTPTKHELRDRGPPDHG
jgi:hypothetical protein